MRGSSLATRLFLSATAWVVVILVITGFVLSSVYKDATERAFDRRLNLYLRTLIAEVATPDEPPDRQFQSLGEPLFELPLSGWYWQITRTDSEKPEVRASRSLWDKKLPKLEERGVELTAAGIRQAYVHAPEGQNLRMVERPVDLSADGKLLVSVPRAAAEIFEQSRSPWRRSIRAQGAGTGRRDARPGRAPSGARADRGAGHHRRHGHRGRARDRGIAADDGKDSPRPRHRHRGQGRSASQVSRRTAGSGGNGRQPRGQRLQMGVLAGLHLGPGGTAGQGRRRTDAADHR